MLCILEVHNWATSSNVSDDNRIGCTVIDYMTITIRILIKLIGRAPKATNRGINAFKYSDSSEFNMKSVFRQSSSIVRSNIKVCIILMYV